MGNSATLTQLQWDADAVEAMRASAAASPWAAVEGLQDNLGAAHLWEFADGRARVLLAVRGVQLDGGRLLEVVGMRSLGDRLVRSTSEAKVLQLLESLAHVQYGADLLSMQTRHPQLVAACERHGWHQAARVVVKNLNQVH